MIIAGIVIFFILLYLLYSTTPAGWPSKVFFPALLFRLLGGIGVGLIYFYHYGEGDTLQFDRAANLVIDNAASSFRSWTGFLIFSNLDFIKGQLPHVLQESRSLFFVKLLSAVYLITGRSYWMASLYFSLGSFAGSWYLVRTISRYRPDLRSPAVLAFLFFPPVVFWSAGILKESIAFLCITLLAGILIHLHQGEAKGRWMVPVAILSFFGLWAVKYHYAAVMLFSVAFAAIYRLFFFRSGGKFRIVWFLLFIILGAAIIMMLHPNFRPVRLIDVLITNQDKIIDASRPGSYVVFISFGSGWLHFFINLPVSLFAGFFMPLPWQTEGILPLIAGIFNFLILLFSIAKLRTPIPKPRKLLPWQWSLILYMALLAVTTAYAAPNFGTLERYKTGYLPFFLLWVFYDGRLLKIIKSKFW